MSKQTVNLEHHFDCEINNLKELSKQQNESYKMALDIVAKSYFEHHKNLTDKVENLMKFQSNYEGKASISSVIIIAIVSTLGLIIAAIDLILKFHK